MRPCPACQGTGVDLEVQMEQPPDAEEWVRPWVVCAICRGVRMVSDDVALAFELER